MRVTGKDCRLHAREACRVAPVARRNVRIQCRAEASPSRAPPAPPTPEATSASTGKARVAAVAAKINAARELARRLTEEKQAQAAASAIMAASLKLEEAELIKKSAEDASAAAAAQAARADALARAMRKMDTVRSQVAALQKLRAENQALRSLIMELVGGEGLGEAKIKEVEGQMAALFLDASSDIAAGVPANIPQVAAAVLPPPPPEDLNPEPSRIADLAQMAIRAGSAAFTIPIGTVQVRRAVRIYYNRTKGMLPAGSRMQLKLMWNKAETVAVQDMERDREVDEMVGAGEWWSCSVEVPEDTFRMEYVVQDAASGLVDANSVKDFQVEVVGGPTEAELMAQRAAEYEAAEKVRRAALEAEEKVIRERVQQQMLEAATSARVSFRQRREEELRALADVVVGERRHPSVLKLPVLAQREGVFQWVGGGPRAGQASVLLYNRMSGALAGGDSVRVHVGFDGWYQQEKQVVDARRLQPGEAEVYGVRGGGGTDWWAATLEVPAIALVVNFVVSDSRERLWDNNRNMDYHCQILGAATGQQLVGILAGQLRRMSQAEDQAGEDAAAKRAMRRVEAKAEGLLKRRAAQQEFLYTIPFTPQAGQSVEVYYNADLTLLRGRPDIFMKGSWNRWRHPQKFGPQRMQPTMPGGIGFLKSTLQVPEDAWVLDLVFQDTTNSTGGFYDSNGGLDYHVPVAGAPGVKPPGLSVVHIAVEMAPIAKVGGMGDVVTALSRAVMDEGHKVEVIIPKFDCINYDEVTELKLFTEFQFDGATVKVWKGLVEGVLPTTFLEPSNGMFWVGCIYGRNDDAARFAFFCGAALQYLQKCNVRPNIVHCHDWQTAPIAWGNRGSARCCFTIHNLNYGADLVGRAMQACEVATTVSPTYAREISGSGVVAPFLGKMFGIRNGIDMEVWNPAEDRFLPLPFGPDNCVEGKAAARRALREKLKLSHVDVPIVGCVTRLVAQKGIHLIKHAAWRTLERGGQFVLLGSAPDPKVQAEFNALREQLLKEYPDRGCLWFAYDEPLSHLIYAGCDMFLVPSMFEPCGLTQMISMAYGTIPVVRKTGGLNDTVFDVDHDEERAAAAGLEVNGFSFEGTDAAGLDYALNRAMSAWYNDRAWWHDLQRRVMQQDWSWSSPALDYIELYYRALKM